MIEKPLTIKDIARMADVSTTTVSRYLNGKFEFMSEDTQQRIQRVVERVGFQPSVMARSLKSKRSQTIGIITTDFGEPSTKEILGGCSDILAQEGYTPMIFNSNNDANTEHRCIQACAEQTDGILFRPISTDFRAYNLALARGLPVVLYDRFWPAWQYDAVYLANYEAAEAMVLHLYEMGYRDIYFLETSTNQASTKLIRKQAYLDSMARLLGPDFPSSEFLFHLTDLHQMAGCQAVLRRIIDAKPRFGPKALFYDTQSLLRLLPKLLHAAQIRVPQDLGICGYDYDEWSEVISPSITSITLPHYEMIGRAARLLIRRIAEAQGGGFDATAIEVEQIKIGINPVFRESTAHI